MDPAGLTSAVGRGTIVIRLYRTAGLLVAVAVCAAGCTGSAGLDVSGNGTAVDPPVVPDVDTSKSPSKCQPQKIEPGPAPLRRLTRFEYDNTVRDLLGDETRPARALPSEEVGNGFGNDAQAQSISASRRTA